MLMNRGCLSTSGQWYLLRESLNHSAKSVIEVNTEHCVLPKDNWAIIYEKFRIPNFWRNFSFRLWLCCSLSVHIPVHMGSANDFRCKALHTCSTLQGQSLKFVFPCKVGASHLKRIKLSTRSENSLTCFPKNSIKKRMLNYMSEVWLLINLSH